MRPRALPFLLILLMLAIPAAMLVYVASLDRTEVEGPEPTGPVAGPSIDPAATGPTATAGPRSAPSRPEPSGLEPSGPRASPVFGQRSPLDRFPPAPRVDPRFAATVTGRVVDPKGAPLAGVEVRALRPRGSGVVLEALSRGRIPDRYLLAGEGKTDATGRFRLEGIDANRPHIIHVKHRPFQLSTTPLGRFDFPGPARLGDLQLALGVTVTGTCRDPSARPLPGVQVIALEKSGFRSLGMRLGEASVATSGVDGTYRLAGLPAGKTLLVIARFPGRVFAERDVEPMERGQETSGVDFSVMQGLPLAGRVVGPDDVGLAGVTVRAQRVRPDDTAASTFFSLDTTDEEGRFSFAGVETGIWNICATGRGLRAAWIKVGAGTTDVRLVVQPARVFTIKGMVVVLGTGAPIEGARVGLGRAMVGGDPARAESAVVTGADGSFHFEVGERPSKCVVAAVAEGFASGHTAPVWLDKDSPSPPSFRIHLRPAARISGRVTGANGAGIGGAVVCLYAAPAEDERVFRAVVAQYGGGSAPAARAATDETGVFRMGGVPPGTYVLEAHAADRAPMRMTGVRLEPGGERTGVLVSLGRGGSFRGSVRFADGVAARGHVVVLVGPKGRSVRTRVGGSGSFAFEHVPPGHYRVEVVPADRRPPQGPWNRRELHAGEIDVVEGGSVTRTLTIARGVRVRGSVRFRGAPRARCRVKLQPLGTGSRAPGAAMVSAQAREATSGEEGAFAIMDAPPGRARISVRAPVAQGAQSVLALEREVNVPRQPEWLLDLDLPGGALHGRVLLPPGVSSDAGRPRVELACAARPGFRRSAFAGKDGAFAFEFLLPGDYRVHVVADERWGATDRRVRMGRGAVVTGVEILLTAGVPVSGVVVDESGEPSELAQLHVRPSGPEDGRGRGFIELRSGAYGKFKIPAIQPGRYTFFAQKGSLQSASIEITVPPGGRDDIRNRGGAGPTLIGNVVVRSNRRFSWVVR